MFYTYVLFNKDINKFYIGYTSNLKERINRHLKKQTLSSKRIDNLKLVYYESCLSKTDALKREKQLKTGFGRGYLRKRLNDYLENLNLIRQK